MAESHLCEIEDCNKPALKWRRNLCGAHYHRLVRYGDPNGGSPTRTGAPLKWLKDHVDFDGPECLWWPFSRKGSGGRGSVWVDGKDKKPANVMCELVNGPRPTTKHQGAHSCGNGNLACCHPKHVSWKTQSGNEADKIGHGTSNHGSRNGQAKLTNEDVAAIWYQRGLVKQRVLAEKYEISGSTICLIQTGRNWGWLTKSLPPLEL